MLMRLKQICNHPSQWLSDNAWAEEDSGKWARLREIAEVVAARQEKMLVFTQFREMTGPLAAFLGQVFGRPGLVLHGETAVKNRKDLVQRFQDDEAVPFFVLSLKAGGSGLNLTAASHVVHFDRWWNPAVENQATDRAFRIGQKRNVLVHKFVCRGTVEEKIDALIESKRGLSDELAGRRRRDQPDRNDERRHAAPGAPGSAHRHEGVSRMSWDYGRWATYVSVAERRRKVERAIGEAAQEGRRALAGEDRGADDRHDVLGQGVVRQPGELSRLREPPAARPHLRAQRLRGRSADRAARGDGAGQRIARSTRSRSTIASVAKARWKALCADCAGGIDSLVELLQGRFSKAVMERICRQETGLFPRPRRSASPAAARTMPSMCKHVAAVLYGVGARLDSSPELLFRLRAVDETDLLSNLDAALPDRRTQRDGTNTLSGGDLAALFDLDMAEGEAPAAVPAAAASTGRKSDKSAKATASKPAKRKSKRAPNQLPSRKATSKATSPD